MGSVKTYRANTTSVNKKPISVNRKKESFFSKNQSSESFFPTIQTKLSVGQPGDKFEVEADAMADKVVRRLENPQKDSTPFFQSYQGNAALQTKCDDGTEDVHAKPKESKPIPDAVPINSSDISLSSSSEINTKNETVVSPVIPIETKVQQSNGEVEELQPKEDETEEPLPLKQHDCRECEESDREVMFKLLPNLLQRAPQTGINAEGSLRKRIVDIAQAEVGKVEAKKTDASGRRLGYDRLLEYFHLAAPGVWPDAVIEYKREGFPSWCGIFSVYAIKTAGIDVGNWQMGRGVSAFNSLEVTSQPQPGDIGYIDQPYQHHCIIKEINGDSIKSIDGNSGWHSEVIEKTRPRSIYSGFFTPFTGTEKYIQKKEEDTVSNSESEISEKLTASDGGGSSMDDTTKTEMESSFGADFSGVKLHTGPEAVSMNQSLNAQAFTHGNNIYFNEGKYSPSTSLGKHLLAHELTHTIQQGATVQRKATDVSNAPDLLQGVGFMDLIPDWIINNARQIPGYTLFTVIIEYDPLKQESVERTPIKLVEGLMGLVPFGTAIFDKLQEHDIIQKVFDWVSGQLSRLNLTTQGILDLVEEAWDELELPYTDAIEVITRKFNRLLNRIERFAESLVDQILTWIKDALISVAEPILEENKAWSLIKKIIKYDPLRDEEVEASTVEILEDFLLLIDRETELEQMREKGTLQETADWLDTQIGTFMSLLAELRLLITDAWDAIQPENLSNIAENFQSLKERASTFLQDVWTFATTVASEVLEFIKKSLLNWLNSFAADIPGFTLMTVILEKNPLTDEVVNRSVENIIRGFMGLIPGGEAKFQELKESGVIPRAVGQIEALIAQLGFSWETIKQLFTDIWNSVSIDDLIDPIGAFERIAAQFGVPIAKLFSFVSKVVKVLVNLLLEIMGIPPDMVANIVANIMQSFEDIKNDPVGFLLNLMNAVKEGFLKFLNNIGMHLMNGFQNWLFGTLSDAGIQMPPDLTFKSILGLAMEVLGVTVDNILDRLALKIGPERVAQIRSVLDKLTGIWTFVKDVIERGPIAIWEYVQEKISNLWQIIKDGIMGFIQEKVIQQAITWLLSFLDVTGIMPVIRGVQTVFNAITSFIEKIREILGIVNSFVAGVAEIARGSIQTAATFLESALADGIPVAISFLAKQLGLGDISEKIQEMIEAAREKINEGIDWLIDKAMEAGTAFLGMLGLGGNNINENSEESTSLEEEYGPEKAEKISSALIHLNQEETRVTSNGRLSREDAEQVAETIRNSHNVFTSFRVVDGQDSWDYFYTASEGKKIESNATKEELDNNVLLEDNTITMQDGQQFSTGDMIQIKTSRGWKWRPYYVVRFERRNHSGQSFIMLFYTELENSQEAGIASISYGRSWRKPSESLIGLSFEELETENQKESWSTRELARNILNYRVHEIQHINPSGKDWEHIVEASTGGAHSSENLVLADSILNSRLNAYYQTVRRYNELWQETLEPIVLREYFRDKDNETQRRWKLKIYTDVFGVRLSGWKNNGRGRYKEIE